MTIERAKARLQVITGLAEVADDEDALALDTLLNEIDGLRATLTPPIERTGRSARKTGS